MTQPFASWELSLGELKDFLSPRISRRLTDRSYRVEWVFPGSVTTHLRLDVAYRAMVLETLEIDTATATKMYQAEVRAHTRATFVDADNAGKKNFAHHEAEFHKVAASIGAFGYKTSYGPIPLSRGGHILDGSHRVASALHHGVKIPIVRTDLEDMVVDYKVLWRRAVPEHYLGESIITLAEKVDNIYVAFLWPSVADLHGEFQSLFRNLIWSGDFSFSPTGRHNLLYSCYRHMDWIGSARFGHPGLRQKVSECFSSEAKTRVIFFKAEGGLAEVRRIKELIRAKAGVGFSSVHITDNSSETLNIARLLLNPGALHFLNYATAIESEAARKTEWIRDRALELGVSTKKFAIDGSCLLDLYGLRKSRDVDVLTVPDSDALISTLGLEDRNGQLASHGRTAGELLADPENFFWLNGVKFISLSQVKTMKQVRGETKDLHDIALIAGVENSYSRKNRVRLVKQWGYFLLAVVVHKMQLGVRSALSRLGYLEWAREKRDLLKRLR